MIILRKNPLSETETPVTFLPGENAKALLARTLKENNYESAITVGFHIVVNGVPLDKDMLEYVEIKETDRVLITPVLSRGSGGQMFKMVVGTLIMAIGAVMISSGVGAGPGFWATEVGAGILMAGLAISTTLVLNALIPPPSAGGMGAGPNSFEGSQMYSITGQSNASKKFGYVPRVYGTHRIYPLVAANPYTEIEADPQTGTLVQFFYAIYDFGYGPLDISEIKIGETPIANYSDSTFRLVDLNKPAVSEGYWDDKLHSDFQLYKGDIERDGTLVVLDKNENDSGTQIDDYQAIRNASSKVNGDKQEIILDFVCPQGLLAYGTDGKEYTRTIDLNIHFSKVGEDNWIAFNDLNHVYDYHSAGGSSVIRDTYGSHSPITDLGVSPDLVLLSSTADIYTSYSGGGTFGLGGI